MGNPLVRYLLTLRRLWGTSLAMQFEYQANLVLEVVAAIANLLGSLLLLSLFYGEGRALGGWSWPQALVVLGVYTLLEGITSTWLRPNLSTIVGHVQQGTLDFVLLKPIDSQFWLSTTRISLMGLPEIATGLGLMIWAAGQAGIRITPWLLIQTLLMLVTSGLLLYSLWFLVSTTSIWFVKTWNATEVLRAALSSGRYPISAFPSAVRRFFTMVLPVAFLTTVPAEAILGRLTLPWLLLSLMVACIGLALSRAFWQFALRFYTSASS